MLHTNNVNIIDLSKLTKILDDGAEFIGTNKKKFIINAETVVLSPGVRPRSDIVKLFQEMGCDVYVVGDARKAGNLRNAIHDAFNVAVEI